MYNLLSQSDKRYVQKEYRYRLGILSLAVVSAGFLVGIALHLPSFFFVQSEVTALLSKQIYADKLVAGEEDGVSTSQLLEIKERLDALSYDAESGSVIDILSDIIYERSEGVSLVGISYQKEKGSASGLVRVEGIGRDRGALVNFQDFLEGLGMFDSIDLPISNYVESENIPFTIVMKESE